MVPEGQLLKAKLSYLIAAALQIPKMLAVDLMALIRTLARVPDLYHELALRLFDMLPVDNSRVDIVADS